jgi:hypothetical protein
MLWAQGLVVLHILRLAGDYNRALCVVVVDPFWVWICRGTKWMTCPCEDSNSLCLFLGNLIVGDPSIPAKWVCNKNGSFQFYKSTGQMIKRKASEPSSRTILSCVDTNVFAWIAQSWCCDCLSNSMRRRACRHDMIWKKKKGLCTVLG